MENAKTLSTLQYPTIISDDPAFLISKVQPCPTSSGSVSLDHVTSTRVMTSGSIMSGRPTAQVKGYPSYAAWQQTPEILQTPRKWSQDKILQCQWCQSWYLACSYQWPDFQPASWEHELNRNSAQQRSVQGWLWTCSSVKGAIPSLLKSSKLTPPYKPANNQYIYSAFTDLWGLPVQITNAPPIYSLPPTENQ